MIVLDTNVISEAMKPEPNPAVRTWLNDQVAETLYLASVTLAEMLCGIAVLAAGSREPGCLVWPSLAAPSARAILAACSKPPHNHP